jgi:hypothetical protein
MWVGTLLSERERGNGPGSHIVNLDVEIERLKIRY